MLENNIHGRGMSPSGASTGILEALELRDDDKTIYLGKSVNTAVDNINNKIKKSIINKDLSQKDLDYLLISLDGTDNKSKFGC